MIGIGVIGYGYWGPNLARNFNECDGARLVAVGDFSPKRLALAAARYPGIRTATDPCELINSPDIDAIAIATPVATHFDLAMAALRAGKHVLVEKPLTTSSEQAIRLIDEAQARRLVLMVDHTFVYTSAVRKMRELVDNGSIGRVYYYDSVRINLGLFQHDVNVIWDLAVHDLSIMEYVVPSRPCALSATGISHVPGGTENIAYMTIFFEDNVLGHIHVNWLAPVKVRRTMLGGSKKMVVYDDVEPSEKIKVYDKGINLSANDDVHKMLVNYRAGDMWAPHLDMSEALRVEAAEFVRCIETAAKPVTDGEAGLGIVRLLEAATTSMRMQGRLVQIAEKGAVVAA
jgi:predicted dehydrogenase